jgi:predicted ester cyclase
VAGTVASTVACDHEPMGLDRAEMVALYGRYLARCNEHRVDELGEFVSEQVSGSGPVDGLAAYIEGVRAVCTAFPDYHWDVQDLVVEEDRIAARLIGQGTHTGPFSGIVPTGRRIRTQELVLYRIADGKIAQCWGDLFPVVRDALVASEPS